jgi:hypothetical protein
MRCNFSIAKNLTMHTSFKVKNALLLQYNIIKIKYNYFLIIQQTTVYLFIFSQSDVIKRNNNVILTRYHDVAFLNLMFLNFLSPKNIGNRVLFAGFTVPLHNGTARIGMQSFEKS